MKFELPIQVFEKNTEKSNFMKIRPVKAELFEGDGRTDGQTDVTELIDARRNFANLPTNYTYVNRV
jgi:hypothetical protein